MSFFFFIIIYFYSNKNKERRKLSCFFQSVQIFGFLHKYATNESNFLTHDKAEQQQQQQKNHSLT